MSLLSINNLPNNIKRYRKKRFPFNLTDNLKCVICSQILLNAVQTDCGCRYCEECIDNHLLNNRNCLTEGCSLIGSKMRDNAINKEIGNIIVKCLYEECKHEEKLKDIGNHLDNCQCKTIFCDKCQIEMPEKMLSEHLLKKCVKRIVDCANCGQKMEYETLVNEHLHVFSENICSKLIDNCPYECEVVGTVNLLSHRKQCSKKPVTCPFSEVGCHQIVTNEKLKEHIETESNNHFSSLISEFVKLKAQVKELEIKLKETTTLKKEYSNFRKEIEMKLSNIEQPQSSSSISNPVIYRSGVFIWKVERFSELRANAEKGNKISITSDSFYTKEFGYKMSMKIYPAGDGVGKSTHLSVFFTLMKGEFDDLLVWPFKNKVTLTILDQKNKTADYSDTFKPDPRSTCYQQPTDEYNIASGSPKFISFNQLQESYLKNDVIFLKISVLN